MTPADRLMALRYLAHGLTAAVKDQEKVLEQVQQATGAKSFSTRFGGISMVAPSQSIAVDDDALLEHVEEDNPDEVIVTRTVRESYKKALVAHLAITGADVIDRRTGEVVTWARVKHRAGYLQGRLTDEAKSAAEVEVRARAEQLSTSLLEVTDG
ncbi:hypothetical protein SAMN04489747_0928 [Auraticoccus monumenti]|uniref:Uncharacterized protein n=2 Tax=Auraticoccus monumenti TaxID=675864 RepID=A0A1G6UNH6_9ACTN|nr:hypothetical protein SAMN04489747_0928 [Auraticoccus monumenti]